MRKLRTDEEVGETVEVPTRCTEQVLVGSGAPQVEMQIVFPRVADATVYLDAVLQDPPRGFPAEKTSSH